MDIWEIIAKNDAIVNVFAKSIEDYEEASRLSIEAKKLENTAMRAVFANRGIELGKTIVRNKETGAVGVVYPRLYNEGLEFHLLTKSGKVNAKVSYKDRPYSTIHLNYKNGSYCDNNGTRIDEAQAKMLFFEGLADALEPIGTEIKSDEE